MFAVTALAVMFLVLHLDLWPLTRSAAVMKQPVLGLVWTALVVVVGLVAYLLGTRTFGMTPPDFLVTVPIPFIFGSVVLLNMLQRRRAVAAGVPIARCASPASTHHREHLRRGLPYAKAGRGGSTAPDLEREPAPDVVAVEVLHVHAHAGADVQGDQVARGVDEVRPLGPQGGATEAPRRPR